MPNTKYLDISIKSAQEIQLHQALAHTLFQKTQTVDGRIRINAAKKTALWDQINAVNREESDLTNECELAEERMRKEIEAYAKTLCRSLCCRLVLTLPRELRELVYLRLFPDKVVEVNNFFWSNNGHNGTMEVTGTEHFWKSEYVGEYFRKELCETWYRNSIFDIGIRYWNMDQFLRQDRWDLDFAPKDLISKLRLSVHQKRHFRTKAQLSRDLETFNMLLEIKNKRAEIIVTFEIDYSKFTKAEDVLLFRETLEPLFPALVCIHRAGYCLKVLVKWDYWKHIYEFTPNIIAFSPQAWSQKLLEWLDEDYPNDIEGEKFNGYSAHPSEFVDDDGAYDQ